MTVLYSNNFEAETDGAAVSGWTGSPAWSVSTYRAVSGTKCYGRFDGRMLLDASAGMGNQGIRISQKYKTGASVQVWLHANPATADQGYRLGYSSGTGVFTPYLQVRDNGTLAQQFAASTVSVSADDIIHTEATIVGTTLELRCWVQGTPRPTTAQVSRNEGYYSAGSAGIQIVGAFEATTCDDVVVADGAGGLDYFYPATASLTGGITLDNVDANGGISSNVALLAGNLTLDEVLASGSLGLVPGSVRTLPFTRNNGTRPTGLTNVALAVLSDDASLSRMAGTTAVSMNSDGTISFASAGLPSVGTSVIVLTREADGKIGAERYTVT